MKCQRNCWKCPPERSQCTYEHGYAVQQQNKPKLVQILTCDTWDHDCIGLSAEYTAVQICSKLWCEEKSMEQDPYDTIQQQEPYDTKQQQEPYDTIQQLWQSTKFPFRNDYRTFCWCKYILWTLVFWDVTLCHWVSGCQCFIFLLWRWTN